MYQCCYIVFVCLCLLPAGDEEKALVYDSAVSSRMKAIESVLWDANQGAWFDYNLLSSTRNPAFYPTNLSPLWAQCYSQLEMGQHALQYLRVSFF